MGNLVSNLGTLGLWVLELFAMYATDGYTDRRTDKSNAYCQFPTVGGIIMTLLKFFVRFLNLILCLCFMYLCLCLLPPTKKEVNAFARVCLSIYLSVCKITQKRVHRFG